MKTWSIAFLVASSLIAISAFAAPPLDQATINQIINDVRVIDPTKGTFPAKLQQIIKEDLAVRTGRESRAELLFEDQTLTRLAEESIFSFKNNNKRDMQLDRGTMLLQVPKGRGGARIRAASVTASITGTTILIEVAPGKHTKVMVLEGSLRLSPNNFRGRTVDVTAGKMVIMPVDAKQIPPPVDVDIAKVLKTSSLANSQLFAGNRKGPVKPLPSIALIEKEIAKQQQLKASNDLVDTNLVILGNGTKVVPADDATLAKLDERSVQTVPLSSLQPAAKPTVIEPTTPLPGANTIPQPTDQNILFNSGAGTLSQNSTVQIPSGDTSSGPVSPITDPILSGGIIPGTTDPNTGTGNTPGGATDPGTGTGGTTGGGTTDPGTGTGGTTGGGTTTTDPGTGTGGTTGGGTTTTDPGTGTGGTTGGGTTTTDPGTGTGGTTGGGTTTTDPGTGTGGTTGGGTTTTDPGTGTGGTTGGGTTTTDPGTGTGGTTGGGTTTTDPGTGTGGTTGGGTTTTDPGTGTGGTTGGGTTTTDPGTGTGGTTGGGTTTTDPGTGTGGTTGGGTTTTDPGTGTGGTTGGGTTTTDPGTGTGGTTGGGTTTTDPGTGTGGTTGGGTTTTDPGTGTGGTTGGGTTTTDPGTGTGGTTGGGTTDPGTGTGGTSTTPTAPAAPDLSGDVTVTTTSGPSNGAITVTITDPATGITATMTSTPVASSDAGGTGPNPRPVTITSANPFLIDSKTTLQTDRSSIRIKSGSGGWQTGTIYDGSAVDGSVSTFLFGTTSSFDTASGFEQLGNSPSAFTPMGVFKFQNLEIQQPPSANFSKGPASLALISVKGITTTATAATWNLSTVKGLLLATEDGPITLGAGLNFTGANSSLAVYARGSSGDLSSASPISLTNSEVRLFAEHNANITGAISASNIFIAAGKDATLGSSINATSLVKVTAGDSLLVNGSVSLSNGAFYSRSNTFEMRNGATITAPSVHIITSAEFKPGTAGSLISSPNLALKVGKTLPLNLTDSTKTRFDLNNVTSLNAEAETIEVTGNLVMPNGATGNLKTTTGDLKAKDSNLTGFNRIAAGHNAEVANLDAWDISVVNDLNVNGNLTAISTVAGNHLKVGGTISPRVGAAVTTMHVISAKQIEVAGGLSFKGANAGLLLSTPSAGHNLTLNATDDINFDTGAGSIAGANFDGGDADLTNLLVEGGDGGSLFVGTAAQPTAGNITIKQPITATSGTNGTLAAFGGKGGTVSMVAGKKIDVQSTIKVSDSASGRASKQGGTIRLESRATSGTAISVSSSGQILSLLNAAAPDPGGRIEFISQGGDILVNGGTVRADRGTVDVRNNGAGNVSMTNATVRGDVVKVGALGPNGDLIIGGGTINADTMLKLYGGSSNGEVHFKDNVTLGGTGTKIIAGKTVTIDNGKTVTIGGTRPADVYTDTPNYTGSGGNGSTTGGFGGAGAKTNPLNGAPQF